MIQNPKVSVLMPVYNGEKYLREAIDSILNQTFEDFEFLIIDDGSTDGSAEIIRSYADPRIRLVQNEKNIGLTRSLNKGLRLAKGEYIARMDADDISLPQRLEKEAAFLDENPAAGLMSSSYIEIDVDGEEIRLCILPVGNDVIKKKLFWANCFCHSASIFRKKCIERVGAYRETFKMAQDYDLWLRIAEEFDVSNIEEPLCKWRVNPCSITISQKPEQDLYAQLAFSLAIQRQVFGQDKLGYKPPGEQFRLLRRKLVAGYFAKKRIVSNKYLMCAEKYPFKGLGRWDRKTAIKYLLKSLLNNPLNFGAWFYIAHRIARKIKNTFESLLRKVQRSSSHVARRLE